MSQITAAVCRAFDKPLAIETLEMAAPGTGELEIALEACAICHSDISYADGDWGGDLPAVFGHEAVGRVRDVGSGVEGIASGDRVLVTLLRACGICRSCVTGKPALCTDKQKTAPLTDASGETVVQGMNCGAFADAVLVLHAAFVVFIVLTVPAIYLGAALHWRWVRLLWLRVAHLLGICIVAAQAWAGTTRRRSPMRRGWSGSRRSHPCSSESFVRRTPSSQAPSPARTIPCPPRSAP